MAIGSKSSWYKFKDQAYFRVLSEALIEIYCATGDLEVVRDVLEALEKNDLTKDLFPAFAKTLGGMYAKAGKDVELRGFCHALADMVEYRVSYDWAAALKPILKDLCNLLGLNPKDEEVVNKSLRALDSESSFLLSGIKSVWKDETYLKQMMDDAIEHTKAMVQKQVPIHRGDGFYFFLRQEVYIKLRQSLSEHPSFGALHVCTAAVSSQIAHQSILLSERDKALALVRGLYEQFMCGNFSSDNVVSLGTAVTKNLAEFRSFGSADGIEARCIRNNISEVILMKVQKQFSFGNELLFEYFEDYRRLLCQDRDYPRLKTLYESSWEKRPHAWRSKAISRIGLALSEYYYAYESKSRAKQICNEFCSHDALVFGGISRQTLSACNLLSEFFTTEDDHEASLKIHSDLAEKIDSRQRDDGCYGEGANSIRRTFRHSQHWVNAENEYYSEQVNLKGRALQRLGRWEEAEKLYLDLWHHLARQLPSQYFRNKSKKIEVWKIRAREREAPLSRAWNDGKFWTEPICESYRSSLL